ncbi:prepilin-type N-terminal cleavage/methylation domain-containing protein [Ureibacillus endophyticus]|uniref:Prepilin-type N-terminal cleavage/methylation domain-containing protein n=1 Tax=Ureibacillus endophyticus TaxID=1978490 RepID=A0A494Z698_9BACL|nr:prepilin-type N-terminal cleavage/methylation domain-containing protein [Lysinibacillus endophyticus]RKQ18071.1 prepilin-type N-terminal cleavage/methylation domain-containing protein [Lysinibacillus endophyticus]
MFKQMNKRLNNQKGLTLIELLAVVVILAIVAAIAVPAIGNIIEDSRIKGMKADIANVINAANLYKVENGNLSASITVADLKTAGYLESSGSVNETTAVLDHDVTVGSKTKNVIALDGEAEVNKKKYDLDNVYLDILKVDSPDLKDTGIKKNDTPTGGGDS